MEALLDIYISLMKELTYLFEAMDNTDNPIQHDTLNETARRLEEAVIPVRLACIRMSCLYTSLETMNKYIEVIGQGNWRAYA